MQKRGDCTWLAHSFGQSFSSAKELQPLSSSSLSSSSAILCLVDFIKNSVFCFFFYVIQIYDSSLLVNTERVCVTVCLAMANFSSVMWTRLLLQNFNIFSYIFLSLLQLHFYLHVCSLLLLSSSSLSLSALLLHFNIFEIFKQLHHTARQSKVYCQITAECCAAVRMFN